MFAISRIQLSHDFSEALRGRSVFNSHPSGFDEVSWIGHRVEVAW